MRALLSLTLPIVWSAAIISLLAVNPLAVVFSLIAMTFVGWHLRNEEHKLRKSLALHRHRSHDTMVHKHNHSSRLP